MDIVYSLVALWLTGHPQWIMSLLKTMSLSFARPPAIVWLLVSGSLLMTPADAGTAVKLADHPTVEYRSPDQFGRGLAFSGNRLLVGAPDDSSTIALAGRAELWSYTDDVWRRDAEWTSPEPDFSGWFGRDVALRGDLMAVVEAGHDTSSLSRGSSASSRPRLPVPDLPQRRP